MTNGIGEWTMTGFAFCRTKAVCGALLATFLFSGSFASGAADTPAPAGQAATARILLVDQRAAGASDAGDGTPARPFRTIGAAAKRVRTGDTVLVRPGVYREAVVLTVSGTRDAPITFQSERPGEAIIDGADVIADWQTQENGVYSFSAPDLEQKANHNGQWVYVNGYPLEITADRAQMPPGSFFLDFATRRVYVRAAENENLQAQTVEFARREGLISPPDAPNDPVSYHAVEKIDDIIVRGFTLRHNADWFRGKAALVVAGRRWLVENNHVLWSTRIGVASQATSDCVIRNNTIEWAGVALIGGERNNNLLVENNKLFHGNWRRNNPDEDGGVSKWVFTINSRIVGNECAYYYGYGLWLDIHNVGNVMEGNTVHDSYGLTGYALFTEISDDNTFAGNVAYNNNVGICVGESPGCVVRRNLLVNNEIGVLIRGHYSRKNDHNLDDYERYSARVRSIPDINLNLADNYIAKYLLYWRAPSFYLENNSLVWENVFVRNNKDLDEARDYAQGVASPLAPFVNNYSDYNLFYPAATFGRPGGAYTDFAAWQSASGRDGHSHVLSVLPPPVGADTPPWAGALASAQSDLLKQRFRTTDEVKALNLGLLPSTTAAQTWAWLRRSPQVTPVPLNIDGIRAFRFAVDGEPVIGIWTTALTLRHTLHLRLSGNKGKTVRLENPFGGQSSLPLSDNKTITVTATYLPIYLRGVGSVTKE